MPVRKVGEGLDWLGRLQSLWDVIPAAIKGLILSGAASLGVVLVDRIKPLPAGQLYLYAIAAGAIAAIAFTVVQTMRHERETPGAENAIPDVPDKDGSDVDQSVNQQARADAIKRLVELTEFGVHRLLHDPQGGAGLPERVDAWEQQVLATLTAAGARESDKSSFRVLIFYKRRGLTAPTPALTKLREEIGEKIERLRSITRKLEEASDRPGAVPKEHGSAVPPAATTELSDGELTFSAEERENQVFIVVCNPQGEPKSGHSLWIEDLQKYSPQLGVGFHPVAEFDRAQKPCELALSRGEMPLYHGKKNMYVLMLGSNEKTARVAYRLRKLQHEIRIGAGTWRFKIRIEWEGRARIHYVYVQWDGPRKPPILTTDPGGPAT